MTHDCESFAARCRTGVARDRQAGELFRVPGGLRAGWVGEALEGLPA